MIFAVLPRGTKVYRRTPKTIMWKPCTVSNELAFEMVVRDQISVGWNVEGFMVFGYNGYYYAIEEAVADKHITRVPW